MVGVHRMSARTPSTLVSETLPDWVYLRAFAKPLVAPKDLGAGGGWVHIMI